VRIDFSNHKVYKVRNFLLNMDVKTIKVSGRGQIAIPIGMRKSANINDGDVLLVMQEDGRIFLEKVKTTAVAIKDEFKDMLKLTEDSLKDIWANEEDKVWSRYLE